MLANTGGLLGLFMGFSVISLVEILYFITCRPYCDHKRKLKKSALKPKNVATNQMKIRSNDAMDQRIWYLRANQMHATTLPKNQQENMFGVHH